jgi:hypothetical protein
VITKSPQNGRVWKHEDDVHISGSRARRSETLRTGTAQSKESCTAFCLLWPCLIPTPPPLTRCARSTARSPQVDPTTDQLFIRHHEVDAQVFQTARGGVLHHGHAAAGRAVLPLYSSLPTRSMSTSYWQLDVESGDVRASILVRVVWGFYRLLFLGAALDLSLWVIVVEFFWSGTRGDLASRS